MPDAGTMDANGTEAGAMGTPANVRAAAAHRPLLEVSDLHAYYGESHVLHGMTFAVPEGEVVTLLGRNGAGKTTTMRAIMGMLKSRKGSIRFDGVETVGLPSNKVARLGIALCPEERGIFAGLNVQENLMLPPVVKPGGLSMPRSTSCFRACWSGATARAPSSPAASSRCWRSPASCAPAPSCCCSTSRPKAWHR